MGQGVRQQASVGTLAVDDAKAELHRIEEDLLYTEKANFQMCNLWIALYWVLGIPSAVTGALAGLSATEIWLAGYAPLLAFLAAVLSSLTTVINPNQRATASHLAGVRFSDLRNRARRARTLYLSSMSSVEIKECIESIAKDKVEILSQTPHTGGLAYRLAKRSIEKHRSHINDVDVVKV